MLLELQQHVVAEQAADGSPQHPFQPSKAGRHLVAPVADRADACMPPLVAMPITQAPDPAPHELANRAPAEIVINIHDRANHDGRSSARSPRFAIIAWCIPPQMSHAPHEPSWPFGVDSRAENFGVAAKHTLIARDDAAASRGFLPRQRAVGDEEIAQ